MFYEQTLHMGNGFYYWLLTAYAFTMENCKSKNSFIVGFVLLYDYYYMQIGKILNLKIGECHLRLNESTKKLINFEE